MSTYVATLISDLGGPAAVAAETGARSAAAVSMWGLRNTIARGSRSAVYIMALRAGVDCDPEIIGIPDDQAAALRLAFQSVPDSGAENLPPRSGIDS